MSKRVDRNALARARRSDWIQDRTLRDKRRKKPMSLEERAEFLQKIISELTAKVSGFTDTNAIAYTRRVISESQRDLEIIQAQLKAKGEPK